MHTASLSNFVEHIPAYPITARVRQVIAHWLEQRQDWVLVLDAHQVPVGILRIHRVLANLFAQTSADTPFQNWLTQALPDLILQSLVDADATLVEPLGMLSASMTRSEVQQRLNDMHLASLEHKCWAVLDAAGNWGLLKPEGLVMWLAANPLDDSSAASFSLSSLSSEQRNAGASAPNFGLLTHLLELLPVPLLLQTSGGQVICQNRAWRTQIGQKRSPAETSPAPISESQTESQSDASKPSIEISSGSLSSTGLLPSSQGTSPAYSTSACEMSVMSSLEALLPRQTTGTSNESISVCVCPQQDGQARVWELIKMPLLAGASNNITQNLSREADPSSSLWLVLAQDITESRQLMRELAAKNAELADTSQFKDEFLSCISHELKTPLTAVLGLSTLLKDQLLGPLNERQTRYARLIHHSGKHLMMIVNDILDVSRIEAGQLDLKLSFVAIEKACLQAYEQARQWRPIDEEGNLIFAQDRLQFELRIQPGLKKIIADDLRFRQMLSNLLSNALKFTVEGKVGLEVETWDRWLAFTVWDTGMGIPPDKQALIFQTFQQIQIGTNRRAEGTGLGLALTQRLARLHGGAVTFTSTRGKGSRFTLLLPPVPSQAANSRLGRLFSRPAAGRPLILLVESEADRLEGVLGLLEHLGCRVAIARNGTEALEKIRCLQPAAVVMNLSLPVLSGWDVLTLAKSSTETQQVPILVMGAIDEKAQAANLGANGFLMLPVQLESLQFQLLPLLNVQPSPSQSPLLTLLHLRVGNPATRANSLEEALGPYTPLDLPHLLRPYSCRVLEVDDLEQAELLVRVWKPRVILLDGQLADPINYMRQFNQYPLLASLPLITLTLENTQAANQVVGLNVFPCLASVEQSGNIEELDVSALFQVMQVAAGLS